MTTLPKNVTRLISALIIAANDAGALWDRCDQPEKDRLSDAVEKARTDLSAALLLTAPEGERAGLREALIESVATAIDSVDVGYSIRLTRMEGDDRTYTLNLDDGKPLEFSDIDEAREHALKVRSLARARAAVAALTPAAAGAVEQPNENEDAYIARVLAMSSEEIRAEAEAVGVEIPPPRSLPASLRNLRFRLESALANRLEEGDREAIGWLNEGIIAIGAALAALTPAAPKTPDAATGGSVGDDILDTVDLSVRCDFCVTIMGERVKNRYCVRCNPPTPRPAPVGEDETGVREAYQYREIGEGEGWRDCSKEAYAAYQSDPHIDTRTVPVPQPPKAETPAGVGVSTFSEALDAIKRGALYRRAAWKPGKAIRMVTPDSPSLSYLALVYDDGRNTPWTPTRCDLLEEDWVLDAALSTAPAARPGDEVDHTVRPSDSSLYDVKCTRCGGTDASGDQRLDQPCVPAAAPAADGGRA